MSYRITEAERKHVAVTEDIRLNLSVTAEEGTTPAVNLEITDSDRLNLSALFPQYAIDVDKTDDEHSRFRLVDAKTRETILTCDGLKSLNGNPLGLGWRYGLEFILDDDGYVKGISLINKNNGNKADKIITKIADMEIKSIVIPDSDQIGLTVNAKALFTKNVIIDTDSTDNALSVRNAKGKHATIGDVQFTDDIAIKTEGKTRLAEISTDDVELVNDESEVSITAQKTTFKDTEIDLDRTIINGKGDSRINELKSLSSQNITGNNITTESLNATSISATSENVNSLEAGNANIDTAQIGVENVTSSNIETATVGNETAENLTVYQNARFEGDTYTRAMDVDGKLIAGEIKSLSSVEAIDINSTNVAAEKVVTNKAEIAVSEVVSEKATAIETRNLTVTRQMDVLKVASRTDVDAARDVIAGNGVITDVVKSKDKSILLEKADSDTVVLGNANDLTVIKTKSDPEKSVFEEEFGHVKAVVDGKEVYLANLEDVKADRFDGYVNRSTNQDISGVKTFNDVLVAPAGIGIKDDEGHFRGIISHVEDYTDIAFKKNPDYVAAEAEAAAYDELLAHYNHLGLDYNHLKELERALTDARNISSEADATLESEKNDDTTLKAEKADLVAQIAEWEESLAAARVNLAEKEGELAALQAVVNIKNQAYIKAQSDVDNELADSDIMSIALRETLYFGRDFDDSFLKDNADYEYLSSEINCTHLPYEEAMEAFSKMLAILDILSGSTQDNVVAYCEITKEHITKTLRPTIENNHLALVRVRDNALNELNAAKSDVTTFTNGDLATANRAIVTNTNKINSLNAQLTQVELDLSTNAQEILRAENAAQVALEDVTEKEVDYSKAKDVYIANYKSYAEKRIFEYTDTMIEEGDFPPPEMSEAVRRFKNDEIPQTDYGPSDTIHLGNSKDTLKVMSKGLHSGENIDQHIQATIDGRDHILANVDDIVAKNVMAAFDVRYIDDHTGVEMTDPGKIVGAINTKASDTDATIVIGKAKVITGYDGQVLPEDQEKPSRVNEEIHIGSEDHTVSIKSTDDGKIDFSISTITDALDERVRNAIIDAKFNESSIILTKDNGSEDELLLVSTSDDLKIEALSDKILDINMDNFYNTESVLKDDILSLYNQVQPRDLRKVANAFDVKVLMDSVSARVDVLAKNLEERLPVAPNEAGRYFLVANVRNNLKGETTATYTWDGTAELPSIHVPTDINDILGAEDYDADGNLFVPYEAPEFAEYGLKMRVIKMTDDVGNTKYVPRLMWIRIDTPSVDYSDSWQILKNHPAIVNAVANGMDESEAIRTFISNIDSNADVRVTYRLYDITGLSDEDTLKNHLKTESNTKIGASVADVVDFTLYNIKVSVETKDLYGTDAKFAAKINANTPLSEVNSTNKPFVEITSKEEAAKILLSDGSSICLIRKNSNEA